MFTIQIAELKISIQHKFEFVKNICKDYIVENNSCDFKVSVSDEEFAAEKKIGNGDLSNGFIESVCIYRKIAEQLPQYNAFVIHAAAIEYKGKAYCFLAKSGTGKTTHIKLWKTLLGDEVLPINGDKPIIRRFGDTFYTCGTPWSGKEMINRNVSVPLDGICVLYQSKSNVIQKLTNHDSLNSLIDHTFFSNNREHSLKTIDFIGAVVDTIPVWKLGCDISTKAAQISFNALCKNIYE